MRFTIDLCQGKGLPQRSRPGTIALAAVPFLIPVLASGLMAARWYHSNCLIEAERAILQQNQQHIAQHAEDLNQYETMQKEILQARHNIKNVTEALHYEMPVSPLLLELVQHLPKGVFVHKLDLDYQPVRQKIVNPQNNQVTYKRMIQRTLQMTLAGPNQIESDQDVDAYIQTLRSGAFLSGAAKEIQITSRQETEIDKQILILYEIRCPFIEQK